MKRKEEHRTRRTALAAMLSALSLAILWGASMAPSGMLGLTALAGLVPAAAVISAGGVRSGLMCWLTTGLLGLLLVPRKESALLYLLFLGLYPVLKSPLEHLRSRLLQLVCKLAFFTAVLAVVLLALGELFLPLLPETLGRGWWLWVCAELVFLVYDFGLSGVISFYQKRIDRQIRK